MSGLPPDFLGEIEAELAGWHGRVAGLEQLYDVAAALSLELGRPASVFDVIRSAPDPRERARRRELIRAMRAAADQPAKEH